MRMRNYDCHPLAWLCACVRLEGKHQAQFCLCTEPLVHSSSDTYLKGDAEKAWQRSVEKARGREGQARVT